MLQIYFKYCFSTTVHGTAYVSPAFSFKLQWNVNLLKSIILIILTWSLFYHHIIYFSWTMKRKSLIKLNLLVMLNVYGIRLLWKLKFIILIFHNVCHYSVSISKVSIIIQRNQQLKRSICVREKDLSRRSSKLQKSPSRKS